MIKVIFVCGVNHSGTTMLDVMLSNGDDNILSCGELYGIKYRTNIRKTFYLIVQKAMNTGRSIYQFIHNRTKKIVIIDSSKFPDWIDMQHENIKNNDCVKYYNIIIYKTPMEIGHSYYKRGKLKLCSHIYTEWNSRYLGYDNSIFIRYSDLATKPAKTLTRICEFTKIPYHPGKEKFWEGDQPSLSGGCTQIMSNWLKKDSKSYEKRLNRIVNLQGRERDEVDGLRNKHKAVYYDDSWKKMPKNIKDQIRAFPGMKEVFNKLEARREIIE